MILDAIVKVVMAIVEGILALIPAYELPSTISNLGDSVGGALASANGVFPVTTLGLCLVAVFSVQVFILVFNGIAWVYNKIPLKFT